MDLALSGHRFRSGGARGMDTAWEYGVRSACAIDPDTIPCQVLRPDGVIPDHAFRIAREYHDQWYRCKPFVKRLMARNVQIILGEMLQEPAVLYWMHPAGSRGTGHSLRIASGHGIPTIPLKSFSGRKPGEVLKMLVQTGQK